MSIELFGRTHTRHLCAALAILALAVPATPSHAEEAGKTAAPATEKPAPKKAKAKKPKAKKAKARKATAKKAKPAPKAETPAPAPAKPAAPAEAKVSPALREQLRKEIRAQLQDEMKAELDKQKHEMRAEIRAAVAASMAAEEWQPEKWEAQPKKKLNFFEMNGYFRVRGDAFVNFDLNAGTDPRGQPIFPRPAWSPNNSDTLATGNQRLRLEPTLNVSEAIKVEATIDVLDNLVWGQTPDTFPSSPNTQNEPLLAFTGTEVPPISGVNAAMSSVSVKRAWAEVLTPVGLLRFGRMASHWGLGILANDGNCLDCDYGDTVDRAMFITKIGNFYVAPMIDTPATGPIFKRTGTYQGQPFDLEQRDDVQQYILAVKREDTPRDIQKMLLDGRWVLNYGLYNVLRVQNIAPVNQQVYNNTELTRSDFVLRDMWAYIPDVWVRFNKGKLRLELEAVGVFGHIGNGYATKNPTGDASVSITQLGAVLQSEYKLVHDKLHLGLEIGFASGDSAPGMGIRGAGLAPLKGTIDGPQFNVDPNVGPIDHTFNNYKFNPDYHVDLILWREILGQVTDALYLKPTLSYDLTQSFGFDLSAIYSRTIFASSAPGGINDLGVELDGTVRYKATDGFYAQVQYGILFPMGGLQLQTNAPPAIAQTLQGMLAVEF